MPESVQQFTARARVFALHYFYALMASSWNAGIATIVASLGIAAGAAIDPTNIKALDWSQMVAAFKYGALTHALFHLRSHPLPEKLPLSTSTSAQ